MPENSFTRTPDFRFLALQGADANCSIATEAATNAPPEIRRVKINRHTFNPLQSRHP